MADHALHEIVDHLPQFNSSQRSCPEPGCVLRLVPRSEWSNSDLAHRAATARLLSFASTKVRFPLMLRMVGCASISYSAKQRLLIRDSHFVAVQLGKRDAELLVVALGFSPEDANRNGLPQGHRIISVNAPVDASKNTVTEAHVAC
jgi:hypothetical protein